MNKYNFSLLHFSIIKKENKHKAYLVCVMYISFYLRMLHLLEYIRRPESPHFQFSMGPLGSLAAKSKTKFNMFYSCTEKKILS